MGRCNEKIIIAGAGRSGTTFLVQILTELGYDTGFKSSTEHILEKTRAGFEYPVQVKGKVLEVRKYFNQLPEILKSPFFSFNLKNFIDLGLIKVKHVIIPVRDSLEVAVSRIDVGLEWGIGEGKGAKEQLFVSNSALGSAVETCIVRDINFTFIRFPDLVVDNKYCYDRLKLVFKDLDRKKFNLVFKKFSNRKMIKVKRTKVKYNKDAVLEISTLIKE